MGEEIIFHHKGHRGAQRFFSMLTLIRYKHSRILDFTKFSSVYLYVPLW